MLSSVWSGISDGLKPTAVTGCAMLLGKLTAPESEGGVVGVLLKESFSFCTRLGILLLGEREDNESLSGRGLGMSIWSRGRALPVSLTWRPLEEEFPVGPALSVGMTAAWGV